MSRTLNPKNVEHLINQALAMEREEAKSAGALGFMARAMVQATLPHKEVQGTYFERRNGAYTLSLLASPKIGLPYGSLPRLLLAWVTSEAVRTQSRELDLGATMSGFMRHLGLTATGGAQGSIPRMKDQARRLFSATVMASYENGTNVADMGYRLADKAVTWWHPDSANHDDVWSSSVTLSEHFFLEIIDSPVPIDMRAMRALKRSPMALDLYSWLTYRVSYLRHETVIPWDSLALQFGSNYGNLRFFKRAFTECLRSVYTVYPAVRFEVTESSLHLWPSQPHIKKTFA